MKKTILVFVATLLMCGNSLFADNGQPVIKSAYIPFDVGEIKPEGWLKDWAKLAADGLAKNMHDEFMEFYRGWGDGTQQGWTHYEQTGYHFDGYMKLAFQLEDPTLLEWARQTMEDVMKRQKPNGFIVNNNEEYMKKWGTKDGDWGCYWCEAVFTRAALGYYSATHDKRVLKMLKKVYENFPLFEHNLNKKDPFNGHDLSDMRKIEGLESLLETARLTGDQAMANRGLQMFSTWQQGFIRAWVDKQQFLSTAICHGVTYNEAAKLPAIAYMWDGNEKSLQASVNGYEFLYNNFVLPNGSNSSNEYMHGMGAFEATEICDISDYEWSNIWLARATGDSRYGDRIERDIFNALPGAVNPSFTQCLYTEATNRIPGFHLKIRDDGHYFKEMHWPTCCPANANRALPNYIANMMMINGNGEMMVLTYGPAALKTKDGKFDIQMQTEYPFRDQITFIINKVPEQQVIRFRVPEWCTESSISINGQKQNVAAKDGFITIQRSWSAGDKVELSLPMKPILHTGNEQFASYKGMEAPSWGIMVGTNGGMVLDKDFVKGGAYGYVTYGPLVCGMSMMNKPGDGFDINEELWHDYRFALNAGSLKDAKVEFTDMKGPFSWKLDKSPLKITAKAHRIEWNPDKGDPKLPTSVTVTEKNVDIKLIPYGFASYRLAMFPFAAE